MLEFNYRKDPVNAPKPTWNAALVRRLKEAIEQKILARQNADENTQDIILGDMCYDDMPEDLRVQPHIRKIFDLWIILHPNVPHAQLIDGT